VTALPPSPRPPEGRHLIDAPLPPLMVAVVAGALIAALVVWGMPRLLAFADPVHARALKADCPAPAELEQLHIVVTIHSGRLSTECLYVGARGTYQRRRP
jgi:hypothetical protein